MCPHCALAPQILCLNYIGEEGLSIQSTYDVNINNPYHTDSIAPNCEILDSPSLNDDELKDAYTILMKGINEWRVQLSTNKTLLSVDKMGAPSMLVLLKFLQQLSLYPLLTMLNLLAGLSITNLHDVGTVRIFVTDQFSKLLLKKPYTNCFMIYNKDKCFAIKMMDNKISFGGLFCHTGPAMFWILSTFIVLLSFIPISRRAQLSPEF